MAVRKLFGTDGIRGIANVYPMTGEIVMALGRAVTYYFQSKLPKNKRPLIILGKDTRLSCYMLEQAFSAGVCSQGGRVILTGPLPTPGVAFVTTSMRAEAGVVISASHNVFTDNGIKIFDSTGHKLPDSMELELEKMILDPKLIPVPSGSNLGNAIRLEEVIGRYIVHVKNSFPSKFDLEGVKLVLDCANGAGYKVGPMVFRELGADVVALGISPNGQNINEGVGSLHPQKCQEQVKQYSAEMGICLDGDADRVVIIDKDGDAVDGDKLIGMFVKHMVDQGIMTAGDEVVGTVMTNLGLEKYLAGLGLKLNRTQVGDRYIIEQMKNSGALIGGEPSGHVVFKQYSTTGDGILAALKTLECKKYYNKELKEILDEVVLFPQVLKNIVVAAKIPFDKVPAIAKTIQEVEKELGDSGRLLVRYSGTEPLARVMVEGEEQNTVNDACERLVEVITKELGLKE
jgi:phosphoglucosamine mutase